MKYEFDTSKYEYSYGHSPKGYGSWAFNIEGYEVFAPSSTYSNAKKWAKTKAKELAPSGYTGTVHIEVLT